MNWFQRILRRIGWGPDFTNRVENGVPNLEQIYPGLWRMGQPESEDAWRWVYSQVYRTGRKVLVIKLNDDREGDDNAVLRIQNWTLYPIPLPPEDDKPWTVVVKPSSTIVSVIIDLIVKAHMEGYVVVWHCSHGRDRTSLISALVGMKLFGWSKSRAWDDMIAHGFRWELPNLDAYWAENVK